MGVAGHILHIGFQKRLQYQQQKASLQELFCGVGGIHNETKIWKMSNFQQQKMQDWRKTSFLSITQSQNKWDQLRHRDSFCKGQLGSWIEAAQYFGEEKQ